MDNAVTSSPARQPVGTGQWQSLVEDIAHLEDLLHDLRDQHDALSIMNRRRLEEALALYRHELRALVVGGLAA